MSIIKDAKAYAEIAHGDQKYGKNPYTYHLSSTTALLSQWGMDEKTIAAGWLHDTVEDTTTMTGDIAKRFGSDIEHMVWFCTKHKSRSDEDNHTELLFRMKNTMTNSKDPRCIAVKFADRICNMRECIIDGKYSKLLQYIRESVDYITTVGGVLEDHLLFTPIMDLVKTIKAAENAVFSMQGLQSLNPDNQVHELKIWQEYFRAVKTGEKPFELRKNDRNYQVGDLLRLMEYNKDTLEFTGEYCVRQVTYILKGRDIHGLAPDYCVMGIESYIL